MLWFAWVGPGMLRKILGAWLAFFLPGFHPWKHDDRSLIGRTESDYAEALMPSAGHRLNRPRAGPAATARDQPGQRERDADPERAPGDRREIGGVDAPAEAGRIGGDPGQRRAERAAGIAHRADRRGAARPLRIAERADHPLADEGIGQAEAGAEQRAGGGDGGEAAAGHRAG